MPINAFSYPLQADHRLKTIGIGGLLHLLPVVVLSLPGVLPRSIITFLVVLLLIIVSALLLGGYWLRVLRLTAQGEEILLKFTDWSDLLRDGLRWIAILIVYLLPGLTMAMVASLLQWAGRASIAFVVGATGLSLVLVGLFLVPGAWTNVMLTNRLGAAFEFRNIANAAMTSQYFIGVVVMITIYNVFNEIDGSVPIMLVGGFIQFYFLVVAFYLIGNSCGPTLLEQHDKAVGAN